MYGVIDILDIHLSLIHPKVFFWVYGPMVEVHGKHLNLPISRGVDYFRIESSGEGDRPLSGGRSRYLDVSLKVASHLHYLRASSGEARPRRAV